MSSRHDRYDDYSDSERPVQSASRPSRRRVPSPRWDEFPPSVVSERRQHEIDTDYDRRSRRRRSSRTRTRSEEEQMRREERRRQSEARRERERQDDSVADRRRTARHNARVHGNDPEYTQVFDQLTGRGSRDRRNPSRSRNDRRKSRSRSTHRRNHREPEPRRVSNALLNLVR